MTHPNPLGHISLGVSNYAASKAFYSAILSPLGLSLVYDSEAPAKGGTAPTEEPVPTLDTTGTDSSTGSGDNNDTSKATKKEKKIRTLGFGPDAEHELLNIFEFGDEASPPGAGFHLAFNAPTRDAVVEFHAMAIGFGGQDNGAPGVRRHYGKHYFAAFVVDPDGWRLEAVCKKEEDDDADVDEK
jgi:catechol 2,3-dioxygenase-like lactoylglutathione lyase family enzyme